MDHKLNKDEKLCSRTAVNLLFDQGKSLMAFPLRAAYRLRPQGEHPVQFLISIPKKRIRRAVMRVTLRRRVREAYRLSRRELLVPELLQSGLGVDIAFVYLDSHPAPYDVIHEKMTALLQRIAKAADAETQKAEHADDHESLPSTAERSQVHSNPAPPNNNEP